MKAHTIITSLPKTASLDFSHTLWDKLEDEGTLWLHPSPEGKLHPFEVAFSYRSAGWFFRADLVWEKPDGSSEYFFLLTKSIKYYYDYEAVRENADVPTTLAFDFDGIDTTPKKVGRNLRSVWQAPENGSLPTEIVETCIRSGCPALSCPVCGSGSPVCGHNDVRVLGRVYDPFKSLVVKEAAERLHREWWTPILQPDYVLTFEEGREENEIRDLRLQQLREKDEQ